MSARSRPGGGNRAAIIGSFAWGAKSGRSWPHSQANKPIGRPCDDFAARQQGETSSSDSLAGEQQHFRASRASTEQAQHDGTGARDAEPTREPMAH